MDARNRQNSESADSYDSASEEEKLPAAENEEKHDQDLVSELLRTIQAACDEVSEKPLEYFEAQNLIRKLATYPSSRATQNAVENTYFKMLEGCGESVKSLQAFILTLKQLNLAAELTEIEQEYWLGKVEKCINEIYVYETTNSIPDPQAELYRERFQALSLNSERRVFHDSLQDVLEGIEERRAASSDFSRSSRESNHESLQSLSPLATHGTFSNSPEIQRAASASLSETITPPRRPRFSLSGSASE